MTVWGPGRGMGGDIYICIYTRFSQIWENIFWRAVTLYYLGENLGEKGIYTYILYIFPEEYREHQGNRQSQKQRNGFSTVFLSETCGKF